jgi:hypothetical protein
MGDGKVILNERKNRREGAPSRIIKAPETPEDEKGEKFHLLHSF